VVSVTPEDHLRAVLEDTDHPDLEYHVRAALQITAVDQGSDR
jgi:hypothetical protein